MSSQHDSVDSIWDQHDGNSEAVPKYCPHCGSKIAHPDNLRENDEIDAVGRSEAYRRHREAHFDWGTDPCTIFDGDDPYLDEYYDGVETEGTGPTLDPDEEVAGVYEVEIRHEAVTTATVVAPNKQQAQDRAEHLKITESPDLNGHVPCPEITLELHSTSRELRRLTRGEIEDSSEVDEEDKGTNYADRLPGWPC